MHLFTRVPWEKSIQFVSNYVCRSYVVVKTNSVLDFIKNNTLRGSGRGGIIFEKIQGRVSFN